MTGLDWGQFLAIGVVTVVVAPLLGRYLAATFRGGPAPGDRVFLPVERLAYRFTGIDPDSSQTWKGYAIAVVAFGAVSTLFLYAVLLLQGVLPFNPTHAPGMSPALSFNTAVSFVTGTDWQAYSGETQASYLAQMAGLVVAQFTAAAVGISVALAVIRGISGRARTIGNFWADLTRSLVRVFVLPFAIALMFGRLIGNRRQGRAIAAVMAILFVGLTLISMQAEAHGNQLLPTRVSQLASSHNIGGSMEGKESRFGPGGSALMTVGTIGTTAGATDSSLDSYTPIGGAGAFVAILLGEVSPGGDGGGLYSILVLALLAVFLAGLMVGRTPEFLGKKIRASQMKLIIAYVLALPITILVLGSLSLVMAVGTRSILNPGMHGLTEVTYAFASSAQNNGSAFAGLSANTPWYNTMLGLTMLIGRFVPIVLALAIAGSLAGARVHARTRATLDTTGPTFVAFLLGVILIMGGLIYLPMLILGPIGERIVG